MSKKISVGLLIVLLLVAMSVSFFASYAIFGERERVIRSELAAEYQKRQAEDQSKYTPEQQALINKLIAVDNRYQQYFMGDLNYDDIEDGILYGYVAGTGDRWGYYYDEDAYDAYDMQTEGEMVGIGIHVVYDPESGLIEIVNVMKDSPALEAGLQPGDFLYTVEDKEVLDLGYEPSVNLMLGEENTVAHFTILRESDKPDTEFEGYEEISFAITRKKIEQQGVFGHRFASDPEIGVIQIEDFTGRNAQQFIELIEEFQSQGVTKFVFDVRNNRGGDLNVICNVLDYLLPEGPIIHYKEKDHTNDVTVTSDSNCVDFPIAVLINENTASAAELFCCALQDYAKEGLMQNIILVGQQTYGKGVMQSIFNLGDGTGLKFTTSQYDPPFSENYDGIGVIPDLEVELDEALKNVNYYKYTDETDNQLIAAVEALHQFDH